MLPPDESERLRLRDNAVWQDVNGEISGLERSLADNDLVAADGNEFEIGCGGIGVGQDLSDAGDVRLMVGLFGIDRLWGWVARCRGWRE